MSIPDDLTDRYQLAAYDDAPAFYGSEIRELIERIGRTEAALREHHENAISEDQAYQGSEMHEHTMAVLRP